MSDVVLAALFAAGGAAAVAIAGAVAQIFGPAFTEGRRSEREARLQRTQLRNARALEWVDAMMELAASRNAERIRAAVTARNAFLATLDPGESAVAKFTDSASEYVDVYAAEPGRGQAYLEVASARLFAWLRGDVEASALSGGDVDTASMDVFIRRWRQEQQQAQQGDGTV